MTDQRRRSQHKSSRVPEEKMSLDLSLACCDLQCEMLRRVLDTLLEMILSKTA